jgi:uncharacterized Zn-binding protein involved in type VI secretion
MAAAGRVGDQAMNPEEEGGDGCCRRPVEGPAQRGSPDVIINGLAALRVGDRGTHGPCDGEKAWKATAGSRSVTINGLPAHRLGDETEHCHGKGQLVEGSPDVDVGDQPATDVALDHDRSVTVRAVDALGRPLQGVVVKWTCPHRDDFEARFDETTTLTGLCTAAIVTVHKALQIGEWDPGAQSGDVIAPAYVTADEVA